MTPSTKSPQLKSFPFLRKVKFVYCTLIVPDFMQLKVASDLMKNLSKLLLTAWWQLHHCSLKQWGPFSQKFDVMWSLLRLFAVIRMSLVDLLITVFGRWGHYSRLTSLNLTLPSGLASCTYNSINYHRHITRQTHGLTINQLSNSLVKKSKKQQIKKSNKSRKQKEKEQMKAKKCSLSNRPHFLWVYGRDKPFGMLREHSKSL